MPDLRQTLAMLAPRVTAAWGPAAAYDLEMRVVPLGQLGEVIDQIGAVALDVELASFLAGPRPKAVAIALLVPAAPPASGPGAPAGAGARVGAAAGGRPSSGGSDRGVVCRRGRWILEGGRPDGTHRRRPRRGGPRRGG
jgi:hypothetical protein